MKRMYRLLICSPAGISKCHGVGMVLHHHVAELLRRGHEVTFATSVEHAEGITARDYPGVKVVGFDVSDRHRPLCRYQGEVASFREFVASFDGDAIISHMNGGWTSDLLATTQRRTRARRVAVGHGYHRLPFRPVNAGYTFGLCTWAWGEWRALTLADTLKRFDHHVFLASGRKDKGFLDFWVAQRNGLPYSIIPNGVDEPGPAMDREDLFGVAGFGDRPFLLNVSNYVAGKGQDAALECFLTANTAAYDMVFIGSTATVYKAHLERLVSQKQRELKGRRVHVLDGLSRDVTLAAFRHATLFLFMSEREAQPMVILEAMAAGVPFVSLDVGCVEGMAGGLVVRDQHSAVGAVNRLLDDPGMRSAMSCEAIAQIRTRYAWSTIIDAYEAMLARLTGVGGCP